MRVVGKWMVCSDGITRPVLEASVLGSDGTPHGEHFLIDSGADRTVFSADLLGKLKFPSAAPPPGIALQGISGSTAFVMVTTTVEFTRDDGGPCRIQGDFAAFTDPTATDLSILGRDVLNHFDLILSRSRNEILLLAGNHQYHIT